MNKKEKLNLELVIFLAHLLIFPQPVLVVLSNLLFSLLLSYHLPIEKIIFAIIMIFLLDNNATERFLLLLLHLLFLLLWWESLMLFGKYVLTTLLQKKPNWVMFYTWSSLPALDLSSDHRCLEVGLGCCPTVGPQPFCKYTQLLSSFSYCWKIIKVPGVCSAAQQGWGKLRAPHPDQNWSKNTLLDILIILECIRISGSWNLL